MLQHDDDHNGVGHFRYMSISGHAISVHKFSVQSTSVHEMSFSVQVNFGTQAYEAVGKGELALKHA